MHLHGTATSAVYATYFGGKAADRPRALARHPRGGLVMAGISTSATMPTTANALQTSHRGGTYGPPSDAFVWWIDASPVVGGQLHYSRFVGGSAGEDLFNEIAVDTARGPAHRLR